MSPKREINLRALRSCDWDLLWSCQYNSHSNLHQGRCYGTLKLYLTSVLASFKYHCRYCYQKEGAELRWLVHMLLNDFEIPTLVCNFPYIMLHQLTQENCFLFPQPSNCTLSYSPKINLPTKILSSPEIVNSIFSSLRTYPNTMILYLNYAIKNAIEKVKKIQHMKISVYLLTGESIQCSDVLHGLYMPEDIYLCSSNSTYYLNLRPTPCFLFTQNSIYLPSPSSHNIPTHPFHILSMRCPLCFIWKTRTTTKK